MPAALDADTDVDVGEALLAKKEDGLLHLPGQSKKTRSIITIGNEKCKWKKSNLGAEDLGLEESQRRAVDLQETTALLAEGDGRRRLLAAKNLHRRNRGSSLKQKNK